MRTTTDRSGQSRAVSSAVSYSIIVVLTLALTGGLIVGTDELVSSQRDKAVSNQLEVVGQQLASTIQTVDRMDPSPGNTAEITRHFPQRVAGTQYRIIITDPDPSDERYRIAVETADGDVSTRTSVSTDIDLETDRLNGGSLKVVYNPSASRLEVQDA